MSEVQTIDDATIGEIMLNAPLLEQVGHLAALVGAQAGGHQ